MTVTRTSEAKELDGGITDHNLVQVTQKMVDRLDKLERAQLVSVSDVYPWIMGPKSLVDQQARLRQRNMNPNLDPNL